jgi:agmatinase
MVASAGGFADLPETFCDPSTARISILPVPYDQTSTWKKGADRGPAAIIEASRQVEWYDVPTRTEVYRQGIATLDPVVCEEGPERLADLVDDEVARLLRADRLPVVLGGDHSVAIGAIRAAARLRPGLSVLQIDAHADTRDSYRGSRFNHACVMARAREWCPVVQVGLRAVDRSEMERLEPHRVVWAHDIAAAGSDLRWMDDALSPLDNPVWVTIDLDGFDPSLLPATGTPEPGGLDWYQVTGLLERLTRRRTVVGFDVVELLPTEEHWASAFLAAKLVYRFLSMIFASQPPPRS